MISKRATLLVLALMLLSTSAPAEELQAKRHDFPPVGKYQVLLGDFHMHTNNSDGKPTARARVEESFRRGYDVISVTDHGNTKAWRVARYVGNELGLIMIKGVETGMKAGEHMNAFGFDERYVPRDGHKWALTPGQDTVYYRDEMQTIAQCGGIVIYNHPHKGYREPVTWGVEEGIIQGIEVKNDVVRNKWNTTEWNGLWCYPDAFDFALKNNLAMFANTDAHGMRDPDLARTLLLVEERSAKGVMDAIRGRRTAAWFGPDGGVVWGRENLLSDLVMSTVSVRKTTDGKLQFENKGPIKLLAVLEGNSQPRTILPYETTTYDWTSTGASVVVKWQNVWTDPRTNLTTEYRL